jgi:uncharacterized repeat protein (TIGR01451 family)
MDNGHLRKAVTNLSGNNPTRVGDVLEYTVTITNSGLDAANDSVLTDPLPPNTTFVSGSLAAVTGPNAGSKSDALADDQAEYVAASSTVRFRLGTGATAAAGGTIGPDASTSVRFRVTVDSTAGGTTLANEATLARRMRAAPRSPTSPTARRRRSLPAPTCRSPSGPSPTPRSPAPT